MAKVLITLEVAVDVDDQCFDEYLDGDGTAGIEMSLCAQDAIAEIRPEDMGKLVKGVREFELKHK